MTSTRVIESCELFQSLDEPQLENVASLATEEVIPQGQILFEQGEALKSLYLIQEGSVTLTTGLPLWSGSVVFRSIVSVVGPNDVIGWSALIEPNLATLNAYAETDLKVLAIDAAELIRKMEQDPCIGFKVAIALSRLVGTRLRWIQQKWTDEKMADLRRAPVKEIMYS